MLGKRLTIRRAAQEETIQDSVILSSRTIRDRDSEQTNPESHRTRGVCSTHPSRLSTDSTEPLFARESFSFFIYTQPNVLHITKTQIKQVADINGDRASFVKLQNINSRPMFQPSSSLSSRINTLVIDHSSFKEQDSFRFGRCVGRGDEIG